jgi:hypothetical protein
MSDMARCREVRAGGERSRAHHVTEKSRRRHEQLTAASRLVPSVKVRRVMA